MSRQMVQDYVETAVTDRELIAAPGAGERIVVYLLHISSDTREQLDFESSTDTLLWRSFVAADTIEDAGGYWPVFQCAENESLTFTLDQIGKVAIAITYQIETV